MVHPSLGLMALMQGVAASRWEGERQGRESRTGVSEHSGERVGVHQTQMARRESWGNRGLMCNGGNEIQNRHCDSFRVAQNSSSGKGERGVRCVPKEVAFRMDTHEAA